MIIVCFSLLYFLFFIWLSTSFKKSSYNDSNIYHSVSIVVAAKNEEKNIKKLVDSLSNQNYPKEKIEIIIANDKSEDQTKNILDLLKLKISNLKVIHVTSTPQQWSSKKWALSLAIEKSNHDIILQTDADCIVDNNWVKNMSIEFNNPEVGFVSGHTPFIEDSNHVLDKMLAFENLSQDAFVGACIVRDIPLSCVGRSIGFRKKCFIKSNGYNDFKDVISGDDDLLMHRILFENKLKAKYVIEEKSFVYTYPPKNIKEFVNQRLRYASKGKFYFEAFFISNELRIILPFLFINNLFYVTSLILLCSNPKTIYLFPIVSKFSAYFILTYSFSYYTGTKFKFYLYFILSFIHPFYIIIFALLGPFVKLNWKNK